MQPVYFALFGFHVSPEQTTDFCGEQISGARRFRGPVHMHVFYAPRDVFEKRTVYQGPALASDVQAVFTEYCDVAWGVGFWIGVHHLHGESFPPLSSVAPLNRGLE